MRRFSLFGGGLVIVLVGLTGACGDPVSKLPTDPSAPGIVGLQISGPASVAPGQSAQFIADARLSDGAVKTTTSATNIRWRSSNTALMQVSTSGVVTAGQTRGEATLTADVLPASTIRSTVEVVIIPDGTYRLVGSVRESETPTQGISGARVEVTGSSLSTTTDFAGNYRLYGVPPSAEIRVTATGYQTITQNVQLSAHTTQNFLLRLNGPRLSLNGSFNVLFDVVGSCSGSPPLSQDLHHRAYEANVTTSGSFVDVQLTEPRFSISGSRGNRFTG